MAGPYNMHRYTMWLAMATKAPPSIWSTLKGAVLLVLGVTQYGVTVSVTTGPQGTSYGVSGGIPQTPVSVGVSCQGGECGGTVGVTANVSGGVTVGASVNTEGDLSGRVGYQVTHQDGETGQVYYDSNTGLGAAVTTTTAQENDDGSTSYIIIGIDSETGLILAGYRSPAAEEAANNDGCVDNDCSNDANGYDETNALSDAQGTNDGGTAAGEIQCHYLCAVQYCNGPQIPAGNGLCLPHVTAGTSLQQWPFG